MKKKINLDTKFEEIKLLHLTASAATNSQAMKQALKNFELEVEKIIQTDSDISINTEHLDRLEELYKIYNQFHDIEETRNLIDEFYKLYEHTKKYLRMATLGVYLDEDLDE
ncbi:hypothetical protein HO409_02415 [Streptococcus suis]|nr:hypothetical protein [Streptococcus suis]NQM37781.1 hypothetical protein [Streptococcus suis]